MTARSTHGLSLELSDAGGVRLERIATPRKIADLFKHFIYVDVWRHGWPQRLSTKATKGKDIVLYLLKLRSSEG